MSPLLRTITGLVAVAALAGLTLGVLGWMKPVTKLQKPDAGAAQSMTFTYSAKVPKSPAYDTTMVTSPEPIFRKLAQRVDVQMRYSGHPGAFDAYLTMSDGRGWHTSSELAASKDFSGRSYIGTVTLDLKSLEDRATKAAEAIGLPPSPVSIAVNARVTDARGDAFSAPLQMSLEPLRLSLINGVSSLVVTDANGPTGNRLVAREIGVAGHPIMTAGVARSYALLLLLAAALGAVVLLFRRAGSVRTRSEIERRYAQLLVPVEPMASPPGKPVVNVDNFPALVRLAERYGQMILTWSRSDADDFVVRDEGITYRYRVLFEEPTLTNIELINRPGNAGTHRRKASSQVS
jgi:hypothetical protein